MADPVTASVGAAVATAVAVPIVREIGKQLASQIAAGVVGEGAERLPEGVHWVGGKIGGKAGGMIQKGAVKFHGSKGHDALVNVARVTGGILPWALSEGKEAFQPMSAKPSRKASIAGPRKSIKKNGGGVRSSQKRGGRIRRH
jgi:hypothetical protein